MLHHADLCRQLRAGHLRHADILHAPLEPGDILRVLAARLRLADGLLAHDDQRAQLAIESLVALVDAVQQRAVAHERHAPVGHLVRAGVDLRLGLFIRGAHLLQARRSAEHPAKQPLRLRGKRAGPDLCSQRLHRAAQAVHVLSQHLGQRDVGERAHLLLRARAEARHLRAVAHVEPGGHLPDALLHVLVKLRQLGHDALLRHEGKAGKLAHCFPSRVNSPANGSSASACRSGPLSCSSASRPSLLSISESTSISLSRLMKRNSLSASSCL